MRHIAVLMGKLHGHRTGQGHIAVIGQQAPTRQVNGGERGRTQAADEDTRTAQIQVVRGPQWQHGRRVGHPPVAALTVAGGRQEGAVSVLAATAEHPHPAPARPTGPACVLQRVHRLLKEEAVLRVHDGRLGGRDTEVRGVEVLDPVHGSRHGDVPLEASHTVGYALGPRLVVRQGCQEGRAVQQVAPVRLDVAGSGKTAGHPHHRDGLPVTLCARAHACSRGVW